ncbi:O-antigen ligase family protein [Halosimplex sp. TS25]|uniref:O-antigen ligase family protein n=1 Tax=Halosimplex rarum TaxID=3396619 RepID=UPI0039EB8BBE
MATGSWNDLEKQGAEAPRDTTRVLTIACFWLGLAVVFTMPWRNALFPFGTVSIGIYVGALFGLMWAVKVLLTGTTRSPNALHLVFVVFACLNLISVLWAIDPGRALSRSIRYVYFTGFLLALWDTLRTRRELFFALQAWAFGGLTLLTTVGIKAVFGVVQRYEAYNRLSAIGYGPNSTAAFLALTVPVAWYLTQSEDAPGGTALTIFNFLYTVLGSAAVFATASRGGLIAFVPAVVFIVAYGFEHPMFRRHRWAFLTAGAVAATIVLQSISAATYSRLATLPTAIVKNLQGDGRMRFWLAGLDVFRQHPLLGVGSAGFKPAMIPYFGRQHSPHNTFVSVGVDLGLVGLLVYGALLVVVLRNLLQRDRTLSRLWMTLFAVWFVAANAFGYQTAIATYVLFTLILVGSYAPDAAGSTSDRDADIDRPVEYGNPDRDSNPAD